ncbi:hypothetical protein GA0115255_102892, partial [Streptomyces sp. Ncost-T6T-2b]
MGSLSRLRPRDAFLLLPSLPFLPRGGGEFIYGA